LDVVEEQFCPAGQALPPDPRHPGVHVLFSQIVPEFAPPQSPSVRQRGTQVLVVRLQSGVSPEQFASVRHCTHRFDAVLQIGVAPVHADVFETEHWKHSPLTHAGASVDSHAVLVPVPLSPLQGSQVPVDPLQIDAEGGQVVLELQEQVCVMGLQVGFVGLQRSTFVEEHWSHLPAMQAGRFASVQAKLAFEPLSPLQAAQTPVAGLQTGFCAGQVEVASHPHFCSSTMQVGVVPVHAVALVTEHCTHCPDAHAGAVEVGHARVALDWLSPLHAVQTPVATSHTGAELGHSALEVQPQVFVPSLQTGLVPLHAPAWVAEHSIH
jgi:hypothetical protein